MDYNISFRVVVVIEGICVQRGEVKEFSGRHAKSKCELMKGFYSRIARFMVHNVVEREMADTAHL